ncbi:MAG TPA: mechanosensitive ion channel domain-containing protein [Myxococcales bacterium]
MWRRRWTCLFVVLALGAARADVPAAPVMAYLDQVVGWYRRLASQAQPGGQPEDVLFAAEALQAARQVTALAFDAARADAELASAKQTPAQPAQESAAPPTLARRAADAAASARAAQQEVDGLEARVARAPPRSKAVLQQQLAESRSELALQQARAQTLKTLADFVTQAGDAGGAGVLAQIAELERSVPEVRSQRATAATAQPAAAAATRRPEPSGVVSLFGDLFSHARKRRELRLAMEGTAALRAASEKLRAPLLADLRTTLGEGDRLSSAPDTADSAVLADRRQRLDAVTARFKKLSAALVPLSKQAALLDSLRGTLGDWRAAVDDQYDAELRTLLFRLGLLAVALAAVFTASSLWRRATFKYIADFRRRQQSLLIRRIVISLAAAITIALSLVSEFGSLATFAGFITAGLAVALQNVILSVVAYFFLIGKYGIRVGDRVQIGSVAGDVMDIGLVRLHVMEVRADGLRTGRVVVFSNAVVFSNTNFFKQLPGSSFTWHEFRLTLAAATDYSLAEQRLMRAVDAVFEDYRASIDRQHTEMEQNVALAVGQPRPESRLHLTESGLEMLVRYPVPLDQVAEVDDRIARALLQAIDSEPRLALAGSGKATLQPAPAAD